MRRRRTAGKLASWVKEIDRNKTVIHIRCVLEAEKGLTLRLLMSYIYIYIYIYIYGAPILDVSRSHTTTQHSR